MVTTSPDMIGLQDATAVDLEFEVAGVGSRSYAFIIDWHIRVLLVLVWALIAWVLADVGAFEALGQNAGVIVAVAPGLILYLLYHPVLEMGWNGWTPGKRIAGIWVVDTEGRPVSIGAHLIRNIFRLVDSLPVAYALGLSVCMMHPRQLRIGDIAAGTVLVFEPSRRSARLEDAEAGIRSGRLTPQQHELALDLLHRWPGLARERRIALGERFLVSVGEPLPEITESTARDHAIQQRLRGLTEE